eukprot:COSAG01_NODE_4156_length_5291_cov_4.177196_7_plen_67_part_00
MGSSEASSCEREQGANRAAEDPEFVLGELWQSLGPGGGEDLWEAWVGGFQRARYVQPVVVPIHSTS